MALVFSFTSTTNHPASFLFTPVGFLLLLLLFRRPCVCFSPFFLVSSSRASAAATRACFLLSMSNYSQSDGSVAAAIVAGSLLSSFFALLPSRLSPFDSSGRCFLHHKGGDERPIPVPFSSPGLSTTHISLACPTEKKNCKNLRVVWVTRKFWNIKVAFDVRNSCVIY